jgi:hypothetical protein
MYICMNIHIYVYISIYIHIHELSITRDIYRFVHLYIRIYILTYVHFHLYVFDLHSHRRIDDDDVYLRLQHGKGFHNLVYMSYVRHIKPSL